MTSSVSVKTLPKFKCSAFETAGYIERAELARAAGDDDWWVTTVKGNGGRSFSAFHDRLFWPLRGLRMIYEEPVVRDQHHR